MKKKVFRILGFYALALVLFTLAACPATTGAAAGGEASPTGGTAVSAALWTGDGLAGKSITILAPRAAGLAEDQGYLPLLVQGELVSNFSEYSAISVLDRENLDKQYAELLSGYYDDSSTEINDLGHLAPTDYLMGGTITKTATGYNLQISVTNNADKMTAGHYTETVTFAALDNLSGVRQASLDLLGDLKVELTDRAKTELAATAAANYVGAQTALARGINAQQKGTEVEALSYYFTASALDANLAEATSRSEVMFANVSSGNIGEDTRNDIAWRRDWIARLTETEQYFDNLFKTNSVPYTLFYSTEIIAGDVNYQTETRDLSIRTNLRPVGSWVWFASLERALAAVNDGLTATKMKDQWGLGSWPSGGVTNLRPFRSKDVDFNITAELVNSADKVIGTTEFRAGGSWGFSGTNISVSNDDRREVRFANVNANDITDTLTIRIARVNGVDAESAARNGVLQVKAVSKEEWEVYTSFGLNRNVITGREGNYNGRTLEIPGIWDEPALTIEDEAFRRKGLAGVNISAGSITSIGKAVFADNPITSLTLSNSVISIGEEAFFGHKLTALVIPGSVRTLGTKAFVAQQHTTAYGGLEKITIGANVTMDKSVFAEFFSGKYTDYMDGNFNNHYTKNGRKAGTYEASWSGNSWKYLQ